MSRNKRLKTIADRERQATKGPWRWWTSNSHRRLSSDVTGKDGDVACAVVAGDGMPDISVSQVDMEFIEHAREDIRWLLREVHRLQLKLLEAQERGGRGG